VILAVAGISANIVARFRVMPGMTCWYGKIPCSFFINAGDSERRDCGWSVRGADGDCGCVPGNVWKQPPFSGAKTPRLIGETYE
ncbi:MAG TPA: hypothetical protein DEQ14_05815, partial [Treponema sp.]|nr:hypothetical protein [Treponema sp.]